MDDGVHWISETEVQLFRNGQVERVAAIDKSNSSVVVTTERVELEEDTAKDFLNAKAREFTDVLNFTRRCGFCEKTSEEVLHLIAGPTSYICNECISICSDMVAEQS